MNFFEAILLGIIQGITEFLPISSTGHLTLAGKFLNLISEEHPENWTSFIAVIQLGTLLAVLIYFWKDIIDIIFEFIKDNFTARKKLKEQSFNARLGWLIIIGTIPIVIFGLGFKDIIEGTLTKNLFVISGSLIILAFILAYAEKTAKFKKNINEISKLDAVIIGIAQACALIPGSSRSGTTITGGLFAGLNREAAARFSFLLSIPAVLSSGLLQLFKELHHIDKSGFINLFTATIVAAVSGYFSIDFLLKYLKKNSTFIFIYYRIIIGIIILILLFTDIIKP